MCDRKIIIHEILAFMISRSLIAFTFLLLIVACIAGSVPSTIAPTINPTSVNLIPTQESSPTPLPLLTDTILAPTPSTGSFELIGHSPLLQRGMNAAPAIYGNYAYIGSRTDGRHADAGV